MLSGICLMRTSHIHCHQNPCKQILVTFACLSLVSSSYDWHRCNVCKQQPHQRPLTRYLPIRSESLNLRQHIESAGHQIELCVHVSLDSTSCRGYLHKMGSKFHHWNRRWFVFDRVRRTLTYYSDRGEKKPRGGVYFQVRSRITSYYTFRY